MTEYKPTYKDRCEDATCKGYGKPLVDRGYGYPVCITAGWRSIDDLIEELDAEEGGR